MLRWLRSLIQECLMLVVSQVKIYKDMAKSLTKMYILLRKSLRQILRTKIDRNMQANIPVNYH